MEISKRALAKLSYEPQPHILGIACDVTDPSAGSLVWHCHLSKGHIHSASRLGACKLNTENDFVLPG